jgi:hypothetical protein
MSSKKQRNRGRNVPKVEQVYPTREQFDHVALLEGMRQFAGNLAVREGTEVKAELYNVLVVGQVGPSIPTEDVYPRIRVMLVWRQIDSNILVVSALDFDYHLLRDLELAGTPKERVLLRFPGRREGDDYVPMAELLPEGEPAAE